MEVLDGMASVLPVWLIVHCKHRCVAMVKDSSPLEFRVGNKNGLTDPFLFW